MATKYLIILSILYLATSFEVMAQQSTNDTVIFIPDSIVKNNPAELEFYYIVEEMPEYPGGEKEMFNFIFSNFNYPEGVNACCKITIEFIVDKDGGIKNIKIVKGLEKMFDEEMLRVFNLMPKWKPGRQRGKAVPVKMKYPINISLK